MALSNVNIISSYFSYGVKNIKFNQLFDNLVKFMVSGYDPFPIESIIVTNGVARVTTTEKNFYSVPGAKLVIAGTGDALLDTKQELQEVFKDGFSFDTEAVDGTYNVGLTYYVAPLGWTLIKKTDFILILKSGSSALTPFYLVFELNNTGYGCITCSIASSLDINNNPLDYYPIHFTQFYQLLPYNNYNNHYSESSFFYGSDTFIIIGNNKEYYFNNFFTNVTASGFGESIAYGNKKPLIINFGSPLNVSNYYSVFYNEYTGSSEILTGVYGANYPDWRTHHGLFLKNNKLSNTYIQANALKYFSSQPSGYPFTNYKNYTYKNKKFEFQPMQLLDENYQTVGYVPGVYFINRITEYDNYTPIESRKIFINGKVRNCIFIKTYNYNSYLNSLGNRTGFSLGMLDLTGPIH